MKNLLIACIAISLSGCVSMPKSEVELLSSGVKSPEFCVKDNFDSANARLEKYLSECYKTRGVNINSVSYSTSFYLSKKEIPQGTNYLIKMPLQGGFTYLFSISIEKGSENCQGKITAVRSTKGIGNPFEPFEAIAANQKPSCPI